MIRPEEITVINAPVQRCFDLVRSVEVHLIANVHSGEQALAIGGITSGLVGLSQRVTWRAKHFGFWHNLTSEITVLEPSSHLQVTMIRGIFRSMPLTLHADLVRERNVVIKQIAESSEWQHYLPLPAA